MVADGLSPLEEQLPSGGVPADESDAATMSEVVWPSRVRGPALALCAVFLACAPLYYNRELHDAFQLPKRALFVTVALAAAGVLSLGLASAPTSAKEKITYAYLADPALEGIMYAIKSRKVTSDKIEIETNALQIPALISSTPAKKYDVIMNAVMAIPFAARRGLELVVLSSALRSAKGRLGAGIWVKKVSPYKTLADLKGKKIGSYSLRATGTTWIRIALAKKYKVNVSYKGGDFSWVQIPAPALLSAL